MRNSQHKRISLLQKLTSPKVVAALVALTLVCCFAIGGTIAWLVTETDPVVNTFTYGDINITLTETDTGDNDNNPNTNKYVMVPGHTITKDPKVTFKANSEDAWLFVKLEKTANFDDFMIYEIADGWTTLQGVDVVYYREVSKVAQDTEFTVIKDDTVTVKGEVTKEMLNALDANGESDYPKLIVTAYAVQKSNINTVAEAWEIGKGN